MTKVYAEFEPDWTLSPGAIIRDRLEELGWSPATLAQKLGYQENDVDDLFIGKVPLVRETAKRLSQVLGSSVDFWLNLEANYERHLAGLSKQIYGSTTNEPTTQPSTTQSN